jgi:protein phosphatase 2C family protein 2/3
LEENAKWFGIYDGHGGPKCSQFLKDKLHEHFFKLDWRKDVPSALRKAFIEADGEWKKKGDNSGSCALVLFIHNNLCYAANLGDSRAILASDKFNKCYQVTKDHKPSNPDEQKRIIEAGGKIYQTTAITEMPDGFYDTITGPLRVFPGRLATTRTFGDFEAKEAKDRIIINEPEITSFEVDDHDFVVMGSDGLWDKFDNTETV